MPPSETPRSDAAPTEYDDVFGEREREEARRVAARRETAIDREMRSWRERGAHTLRQERLRVAKRITAERLGSQEVSAAARAFIIKLLALNEHCFLQHVTSVAPDTLVLHLSRIAPIGYSEANDTYAVVTVYHEGRSASKEWKVRDGLTSNGDNWFLDVQEIGEVSRVDDGNHTSIAVELVNGGRKRTVTYEFPRARQEDSLPVQHGA